MCREAQVTLIQLNTEIRAKQQTENEPQPPNPTKPKAPNTQSGKVRISGGLREPKQNKVKSGETGQ